MYNTLSSLNGNHEYVPNLKGTKCNNTNPNIRCDRIGCVRCQPACKICGLYHPPINYSTKPLSFRYSLDNPFAKRELLYSDEVSEKFTESEDHEFEPDNNRQVGHNTNQGKKYCYDANCSRCRPTCRICGKIKH